MEQLHVVPVPMMPSRVKRGIREAMEDKCLDMSSARVEYMKNLGTEVISKSEENVELLDEFSAKLHAIFDKVCKACESLKLHSSMRVRLWSGFHNATLSELPPLWETLFSSLDIECKDKLLCQTVNQKVFDMVMVDFIKSTTKSSGSSISREDVILTKDELNALQYISGFVPHALLKRFERHGKKYQHLFECLGEMAVVSEHDSDVLEYTKEWMAKVNRGGLFPLNNQAFTLFVEIEKQTRVLLTSHMLKKTSEDLKDGVISKVVDSDGVQFHWTLLCQCIEKEEDVVWLLAEIVKLYVTIRGFSIAAMWMEQFKRLENDPQRRALN